MTTCVCSTRSHIQVDICIGHCIYRAAEQLLCAYLPWGSCRVLDVALRSYHIYQDVKGLNYLLLLTSSSPGTKWSSFRRRCFQMHFREWEICILIKMSLKFVPKGPIENIPALVQIMAWRRIGDKLLLEPMLNRSADIYAALGGDEYSVERTDGVVEKQNDLMYYTLKG